MRKYIHLPRKDGIFKVKKKRFVKRLMGKGISRNKANQIAAVYHKIGMPYCMTIVDYDLDLNSHTVQEHLETISFLLDEVARKAGVICKTDNELNAALLTMARVHAALANGG